MSRTVMSTAAPMIRLFDLIISGYLPMRFGGLAMGQPWPVGSGGGREVHVRTVVLVVGAVRPAAGDGLGAGVEADAFRAVHVGVAEQGVLPAAEGVEGHRDRARDVDADHPDLDVALELARGLAAGGEDRGAVAVLVRVDDVDGLGEAPGPQHDQYRAEDLVGV